MNVHVQEQSYLAILYDEITSDALKKIIRTSS